MKVYRVKCGQKEFLESDAEKISRAFEDAAVGSIFTVSVEEMTQEKFVEESVLHLDWKPPAGICEVKGVKLLWHSDYWDGPLSGMCLVAGERLLFECLDDENRNVRIFGLYRLSADDLALEEKINKVFCEKVGTHCNYDETGKQSFEHPTYSSLHYEFYDWCNALEHKLKSKTLIGWFHL